MVEYLNNIDTEVFLFLNGLHNGFFDFVMYWLSNKFIWIPLYLYLLYLLYKYYKDSFLYILPAIILLVVASDQISVQLFKNVFMRLRPCHNPELVGLVHLVKGDCGGQYGFISSHATNHFAIATFLSLLLGRRIKYFTPFIFLWAALIAYSRIYLGVHYPGDVIAGAIVGILIGLIIWILYKAVLYFFKPLKSL